MTTADSAPTLLEVSQLGVEFQTRGGVARVLDDVAFTVHRGETLGLVGESGCGKSMTALAMMRLIPTPPGRITSGRVALDGCDLLTLGEPEMRQSQGLFFNLPISENLLLGREAARDGWVRPLGRERAECEALLTRWGIKAASIDVPPDSLSGGNQQKVVLAKWLLTAPRILLLDEPTKGVDVGAKHDIHHLIREEAALGMGCLVVSSDLPELLALADRIVVLKQGRVQGELLRGASEEDVMHLATRADESDAA